MFFFGYIEVDVHIFVSIITINIYLGFSFRIELEKIKYDHCTLLCTDHYQWHECWFDCFRKGFQGQGLCASPSPNVPKKCCCQTEPQTEPSNSFLHF